MKLSEIIEASPPVRAHHWKPNSFAVVKGDPKGVGKIVFKGSAKKARSTAKALKGKGEQVYVINSPKAKVGQKAYHKKGYGLKIEFDASIPEVSPPDRKHQVKGIKKHMAQKKGKDKIPKTYVDKKTGKRKKTNPWALAWAQYDKYGVPSRIEKD